METCAYISFFSDVSPEKNILVISNVSPIWASSSQLPYTVSAKDKFRFKTLFSDNKICTLHRMLIEFASKKEVTQSSARSKLNI